MSDRASMQIKTDSEKARRFRDMKEAARQRMGISELTHAGFLSVLLDVYAYHLEGDTDELVHVVEVPAHVPSMTRRDDEGRFLPADD